MLRFGGPRDVAERGLALFKGSGQLAAEQLVSVLWVLTRMP